MRHGDKIKNLGRKHSHRHALLSNLTIQLIEHKRLTTTLAKAKSLRVYAEPIINRAKSDTMHNRRMVFASLQSKEAIKELFGVISDKVADRPGGYTRVIKLPKRMGDAADMAMIELVDFNEIYVKDSGEAGAKKTRRSRRGGGSRAASVAEAGAEAQTPAVDPGPEATADTAGTADTENTAVVVVSSIGDEGPPQVTQPSEIPSDEAGENDPLPAEGDDQPAA